MRNTVCWLIIAILTLQVSLSGLETSNDNDFELDESDGEVTNFAGRQAQVNGSSGMNGNSNADSDCNLTNWANSADGLGGPVWQNGSSYTINSIVEWPANSGHFYQTNMNNTIADINHDDWLGPCTCAEVGEAGGVVWDSTMSYSPWQIVEHNGTYWIAQDAGALVEEEPGNEGASGSASDFWVPCTNEGPCASILNIPTPVWENSTLVTQGEVYQYPANSGLYYTVVGVGMSNQTVGAPGLDFDAWGNPLDCDCKEIWADTGSSSWDASIGYVQGSVVEYPAGTNNLYQALQDVLANGYDPTVAQEWELCVTGDQPSSNPCEEFNGYGGMNWDNMTLVSAGEIYQFPAGSGQFYSVSPGISNQTVGEPGYDLDAWSEKYCECKDIWMTAGSPVWNSSTVYSAGMMVEYPIGTGDIWMALVSQTTTGVTPDQPFADGNQWELCGGEGSSEITPCAGLTIVGVWDSSMNVTSGEIYEYSGMYYQVNPGSPFWSVNAPDLDMDVWSPIECPCKETWVANNQPVWDGTVAYLQNDVVEWPAGTGHLYMAEGAASWVGSGMGTQTPEPTTDDYWIPCDNYTTMPSSNTCAGLDVLGVWDSSLTVSSGEIYEYPANSETYYQVNQGSPFTNVNAPDVDMDVWSPIDCPCKETWVANNQPVWDASVEYPGNYVVEWPAGTGNLYIPLEPTGVGAGAEPGIDIHWVLCDGEGPSPGPCDGLNVPVWDNSTAPAVGDIYEYPANSGTYHQIIFIHADSAGGPDWVSYPDESGAEEFWVPHSCPCKPTWVANGQPVWDDTITFYPGNYVVEWPAGSGALYISEGGGLTGSVEPGTDGHWIPCEGNPEVEAEEEEAEEDSIPSIGVALTLLGILSAAGFISRSKKL